MHGLKRPTRGAVDPAGLMLVFTAAEWVAFTAGIRAGELD